MWTAAAEPFGRAATTGWVQVANELDDEKVGRRLKLLRALYGETQEAFGARFGLSQNQYNQYEKGTRHLPVHRAMRLAQITGVTLDWIYLEKSRNVIFFLRYITRCE